MSTALLPADPAAIRRAAEVLRRGGLVAFPTETVYGLGANALDAVAVGAIFAAKGRPANNPLIVHVADLEQVPSVAAAWPETAARLAGRFWPGPLTLVLPRRPEVPDVVTAGGLTVAVRIPAHPVALALLRAAGLPIAAPSANRSTQLSPTRAEHVAAGLAGRVELILDGGPCPGGLESTVLDVTSYPPRLLRPGLITPAQIEELIGPVSRLGFGEGTAILPSPGMMRRHYAPRAVLHCLPNGAPYVEQLRQAGFRVGWLTVDPAGGPDTVSMPCDPVAYAARLYESLHALDASGVDHIVVDLPPETEEWLAVRDRLRRASTA